MTRVELADGTAMSRLVYGMWRLADDSDTSAKHVRAKIDACLDQGITTFDQADIYGDYSCEALLGQVLSQDKALRQRMEIVTKCDIKLLSEKFPQRRVKQYDTSAAHIQASVDASLAHMAIDYIDVLLLHRPDPLMDAEETAAALDALIQAGKVRSVGVSNFQPWDWRLLQRFLKAPLVTNQIEISLLESRPLDDGSLAFLQEQQIAPMAWSPLAGGRLFAAADTDAAHAALPGVLSAVAQKHGVQTDALAIAWLLRHPANIIPVLGSNALERIQRFSEALAVDLPREDWFELLQAARGHEVA